MTEKDRTELKLRPLTASTSAGSYHTLMYGCCNASSTDIRLAGSMISILDSRSLAWLAVVGKTQNNVQLITSKKYIKNYLTPLM